MQCDHTDMNRYELAPYTRDSKGDCPACGTKKALRRYVDLETGQYLPDHVGLCDRMEKCGYKYTAWDWADDEGETKLTIAKSKVHPSVKRNDTDHYDTFSKEILFQTLQNEELDVLSQYLLHFFHNMTGRVTEVLKEYKVGMIRRWDRNVTVFWQISATDIRTAKLMAYEIKDGDIHRVVKTVPDTDSDEPGAVKKFSLMNWLHRIQYGDNFNLRQCLFGEHLAVKYPDKIIHIVESEKTALIAQIILPRYLWMACGTLNGISEERLANLKGRTIKLFPDKGKKAFTYWSRKADELKEAGHDILCSRHCEDHMEGFPDGSDVADRIIEEYVLSCQT